MSTIKKNPGCGVVLIASALFLSSFLIIIIIASIMGIADGEPDVLLGGLIIGLPMGIAIFWLVRTGLKYLGKLGTTTTAVRTSKSSSRTAGQADGSQESDEQIVEITTIAGTAAPEYEVVPKVAGIPVPAPEAPPVPAPEAPPAPAASAAPTPMPVAAATPAPSRTGLYDREPAQARVYAYEKAVLRSHDVFATLRDFASHTHEDSLDAHLASMLNAVGIADWQDAPKIEAVKLGRSGSFWLGTDTDELSDDDFDRFLGIECALNVSRAMRSRSIGAGEVLRTVADLEPLPSTRALPGIAEGAQQDGEWMTRLRFAEFVENAATPFRLAAGMQSNTEDGLFVVDLTIPRPNAMAFYATNRSGCICTARAYGLRSALLCARKAFDVNPALKRVVVNCGVVRGESTLLSLDLDRTALARLLAASRDPAVDQTGFPQDPALRASFDQEGWFLPVDPFLAIDAEAVMPWHRHRQVELMMATTPPEVEEVCGARIVADLGINEHALRAGAWSSIADSLGTTTGEAVSCLMALREKTGAVDVAEAANRVSKALVEGTVDVADRQAMARLFVDGSLLDTVARKAREALDNPDEADLEALCSSLDEVLSPLMSMGAYLDNREQVYRYFNSHIERIWFNLNREEGGLAVSLVPDSYYTALSCAARALSMLDRGDEALAYTDELLRIAPATPDAALVRVRVLENMSRIYDAVDLLKETITRCSVVGDLAVCFYRLAYMEWKLGRSDLAVACYERAISLRTQIAPQATDELDDLLESDDSLEHLSEKDAAAALEAAGIPLGDPKALRLMVARAAIATADAGYHSVAAPLTGTLIDAGRDDVLVDVYHSLRA